MLAEQNAVLTQHVTASAGTPGTGLDAFAGIHTAFWCAGARRNVFRRGMLYAGELVTPYESRDAAIQS
jgi:hypothetical protein